KSGGRRPLSTARGRDHAARAVFPAIILMSSRALRNDGADYALDARARPSVLRRFEPALEAEYRIFLDAALLLRVRWALGAAVVVLCVYAGLDLIMIPAQILPEVLAMRLGLMVLPPLLVLAVSFHPRCRHLHV